MTRLHPKRTQTAQVKIWFQNRRTKWKKQENISNSEASEHKIGGDKYVTSPRPPSMSGARVTPPKPGAPTTQPIADDINRTMKDTTSSGTHEAGATRTSHVGVPSPPAVTEVTTAPAQHMHRYSQRSSGENITHDVSVSIAMPRLSTPSPLGGADGVCSHDTSSRCARDAMDNGRYNGEAMHTQFDGDGVSSFSDSK
ncbi:hypothetical protein NP493_208g01037 [Ridgeia piscesae]|uniref:Homeobox domain-containing protein n=1 Tax=Ridgeia piscesae TaxID=27915 RepID=A0AAD9P1F2_RIDPI|nr:hypothetical protein NP493_208g01037 [Ridgeia piscesae]